MKVVPSGTCWSAGCNPVDPPVRVHIGLPVRWIGGALEEVDLELDIPRAADGSVRVRDRDELERVREGRERWAWP